MSDISSFRESASASRAAALFQRDPKLVQFVWSAARENSIDPLLAVALVEHESRFNPNAIGTNRDKKGNVLSRDWGLAQINDRTFRNASTMTTEERVSAGFKHLAWLLSKHKGNMEPALREYNGGGRWKANERTALYARAVLGNYTKLSSGLRAFFAQEGIAGSER